MASTLLIRSDTGLNTGSSSPHLEAIDVLIRLCRGRKIFLTA
jgi:hypothetical protein